MWWLWLLWWLSRYGGCGCCGGFGFCGGCGCCGGCGRCGDCCGAIVNMMVVVVTINRWCYEFEFFSFQTFEKRSGFQRKTKCTERSHINSRLVMKPPTNKPLKGYTKCSENEELCPRHELFMENFKVSDWSDCLHLGPLLTAYIALCIQQIWYY